jgi:putative acetyltransferase
MHTAAEARGRGVGRALLDHLLIVARSRGYHRVSLETGTTPGFGAARAMYEAAGFRPSEPFADYVLTGDNTFYALPLG